MIAGIGGRTIPVVTALLQLLLRAIVLLCVIAVALTIIVISIVPTGLIDILGTFLLFSLVGLAIVIIGRSSNKRSRLAQLMWCKA